MKKGGILGLFGSHEKRDADRARRLFEEALAQQGPNVALVLRVDDCLPLYITPNFERIFGVSPERISDDIETLYRFIPDSDRVRMQRQVRDWDRATPLNLLCSYHAPHGAKSQLSIRFTISLIQNGTQYLVSAVDVTTESERIAKAEAERDRAVETANARTDYMNQMSHEIRTPLNAIVGFSNLLIETEDPADKKEYVDIIQRNNEQLLQLISDILDLSKIEAGMVELSYTKIELNLLCQEVVSSYMADTEREVPIVFAGGCDDCYIISDRSKLVQVLSNLINNAIKFTQQGCITVGFRKLQKGIEFYVQDTGIGIVAENIQLIFNRFEKLNHFAHGTGLGLTICRNLVEKLDGTIGVESEPGIGSRFWFTVPYEPAGLHRAEDALLPPSHGLSQISPGKPVILVAEDTDSNFQVLSAILRNDYELLRARDGDEAVRLVEQYRFVAVLMDMKMPVMDGLEATRKIKAVNPTLPVIAVTAYAYDHDREKALQAGCNDYMTKPMDVTELKQKLSEFVKDKH